MIGRIADARGRRFVIVSGALLAAIGGALAGQTDTLTLLLACRALTGIGEAAVFVGAATLVADLSPRARRAEGASYFSVAVFTGVGFGPIIGEYVLSDTRFEEAFLVGAGFALLAAMIAVFAPARVVSPDAASDEGPPRRDPAEVVGWRRFVHPEAILPGLVLACGIGGLTTFFAFAPDYSRSVGLSSRPVGSSSSTPSSRCWSGCSVPACPSQMGPRRAVTLALSLIAAGLLVFAADPGGVGPLARLPCSSVSASPSTTRP